ncbi:MAG: hypothetical protein H0U92_04705 [Actinobacteria bacterium]|nr:hypothetical protein [Actinomycetota bacterium]
MTTQALPAGKKRFITPYRIGVSVLLAIAAAILYVGVTSAADPEPTEVPDPRITSVQPAPDELALRQDRIFAQLANDYTGVLIVDGTEIPDDQIDRSEGLNTVAFTPGKGTETGRLDAGERCATVVFWSVNSTREAGADSYKWCWQVH